MYTNNFYPKDPFTQMTKKTLPCIPSTHSDSVRTFLCFHFSRDACIQNHSLSFPQRVS